MSCRWVSSTEPRVLPNRHREGCGGECEGCLPCGERHCVDCGKAHLASGIPLRCPECVGAARDGINEIAELSNGLLGEALHRGINSEAAMLAGPAADSDIFGRRLSLAIDGKLCQCDPPPRLDDPEHPIELHPMDCPNALAYIEDARDERHPLYVLGSWDLAVTEHYGHERTQRVTIETAAAYLKANLTQLAQDAGFAFDELAREVAECVTYIENVLRAGEQIEKGAPCLTCKRPLDKATDDKGRVSYHCPKCHKSASESQYRYAVRLEHRARADRLPVVDLAERIGVSASTVRRWVGRQKRDGIDEFGEVHYDPPLLHSCGRNALGHKVYRVSDAETLRDSLRANAG